MFDRKSDLAELGLSSVGYSTLGGGVVFGVPFTEFDRVFFGLRYENTEIDLTPFSPLRYVQYVEQFGAKSDSLALTTGWSRDDRDNLLVPTRGRYQRVFTEVGLPGLDLQYYRLTYQFQQYFALFPRVTLAFNGEIGYGDGYSGDPYPFFKNYYVGGIGSVRGFETGSLGPRDIDDSPLGGNRRINFSFEAYVPIPGADRTLRALTFVDAGWVWGQEVRRDANGIPILRQWSAAVRKRENRPWRFALLGRLGVAWISPLGPLRLSYAYPLNTKPEDRIQRFQFQIGTGF